MRPSILPAATEDSSASFLTSSATTANPLPASPALAASMAAFRARRLVWSAIFVMVSTKEDMDLTESPSCSISEELLRDIRSAVATSSISPDIWEADLSALSEVRAAISAPSVVLSATDTAPPAISSIPALACSRDAELVSRSLTTWKTSPRISSIAWAVWSPMSAIDRALSVVRSDCPLAFPIMDLWASSISARDRARSPTSSLGMFPKSPSLADISPFPALWAMAATFLMGSVILFDMDQSKHTTKISDTAARRAIVKVSFLMGAMAFSIGKASSNIQGLSTPSIEIGTY